MGKHTKGVIFNSPNNPSGKVYSQQDLERLCAILKKKSDEFSHPIFLIADEPYREIVYDKDVPYAMNFYADTIVCYSYSKSLSLPGERIGYIAVNPKACHADELYFAICGAGRSLGYVCAPSTYQKVVEKCVDALPDIAAYRKIATCFSLLFKQSAMSACARTARSTLWSKPLKTMQIFSRSVQKLRAPSRAER